MTHERTDDEAPNIDWDSPDDDPIVEEVRRVRAELAAEFGGNRELQDAARRVENWACSLEGVTLDRNSPNELPLPQELAGLVLNREEFIRRVRMCRGVYGKYAPDLNAYNEDARYRARVLGFEEESFVVQPSDFPPDWTVPWEWPDEEEEEPAESKSEHAAAKPTPHDPASRQASHQGASARTSDNGGADPASHDAAPEQRGERGELNRS
jgi:hypothetical protein